MAGNTILTLAVVAASLIAVQCMSKPSFCKSYDCPAFDSVKMNGFERRSYGATKWVGTSVVASSSDSATNGMFMKLFRYIGGANDREEKIAMTVPVATKVQALSGNQYRYTMMFYVPGSNPPTPNDNDLEIITIPARDVYVKTFYTYFMMAGNSKYTDEVDELRTTLDANSMNYDTSSYYQVGYTSPFWPIRKHHEVWLDSA
ncbi:heme-binding protein 2-like [Elysia marginata]|uniref:Heme-binding protein 2-like n=1 Tax=Elysia marginata TaxID=1093978 RepID=A0AAV4JD08_9GAST|nr:heme-binding protein 2-like [Elysia marginata]